MKSLSIVFFLVILLCASAAAQTTAFTYQGSLRDGASPANGNYDFEFRLFDLVSAGTQQGSTVQRLNIAVANGIFTVSLDFGAGTLPGADRFLDMAVRTAGGGAFTPLTPRQKVNSAPYSVKSLNSTSADVATNATQLGGVAANQYVVTTDPRMTDARSPTAGSADYIQNGTSPQASSNFNISGDGTAGGSLSAPVINAASGYDIAGVRILSNPGSFNLFAGASAGVSNTSGSQNAFFGGNTGLSNSTGSNNSFFGNSVGINNGSGFNNSFFGSAAGVSNTTAAANSFFGVSAGQSNTIGANNAFFGAFAGQSNQVGANNSFFGRWAGLGNTNGNENVFFGTNAGVANTTGSGNTAIGISADLGSAGLTNATAIGNRAFVTQSNSLVLGSINGVNSATANTDVGIGTTAPSNKLHVIDQSNTGLRVQTNLTGGTVASFGGFGVFGIDAPGVANGRFSLLENGNVGIGVANPTKKLHVVGEDIRVENTATAPRFSWHYDGGGIDGRKWQVYADGASNSTGTLTFAALNDAENDQTIWLSAFRIGMNVRDLNMSVFEVIMSNNLRVNGSIALPNLGGGGASTLCYNASNRIVACSSSLRYKTNIAPFSQGMSIVNKLRPITFDWKDGGMKDVGFGAEDIAKIDPRFVTYNDKGEVEGVKYDRLSVAFVNAFKEQQEKIEILQTTNTLQQQQIDELKKIVCSIKADAEFCK